MEEIQVRVKSGSKDRDDTRHQHDSCPDEGVSHILHQCERLYQRTVSKRYPKNNADIGEFNASAGDHRSNIGDEDDRCEQIGGHRQILISVSALLCGMP